MGRLLILRLSGLMILALLPWANALRWEDEDSVVVEAFTKDELFKQRSGTFPFPLPWHYGPAGRARSGIAEEEPTCYTTLGEEGRCAILRECYPMLYSDEGKERHELVNPNLVGTLKSISGPCDMPNFSKFRVELPDSLICCPTRIILREPASTVVPTSPKPVTPKPGAPIPDAVASYFFREQTCGYMNNTLDEGEEGRRFPWIVALVGSRGHFCAGSLIDQYHVLSAASCVYGMSSQEVSNIQVYLGDYKLHSVSDGPLIVRKVSRVIYHRDYDEQTLNNDIALLRFKLPAPVGTARVLPICLPKRPTKKKSDEALLVGVEATLAGWGRSWIQSPVPVLQKTKMMIWNNEDCRVKYGYLARNGISDNNLCAYPSTRADAEHKAEHPSPRGRGHSAEIQDCIGDTGGPLTVQNKKGNFEQVGVVSWNIGCSHYPYIHTRVTSYLNWIEKNRRR